MRDKARIALARAHSLVARHIVNIHVILVGAHGQKHAAWRVLHFVQHFTSLLLAIYYRHVTWKFLFKIIEKKRKKNINKFYSVFKTTSVPSDKPQAKWLPSLLKAHERTFFSSSAIFKIFLDFKFQILFNSQMKKINNKHLGLNYTVIE